MTRMMVNFQVGLCIFSQLCVLAASQRTFLDSPPNLFIWRAIRNYIHLFQFFENEGQTPTNFQRNIQLDIPFPCNVTGGRSSKIPNSVHRLRPGDIDVIAAIGDSLTAGSGIFAKNLLEIFVENRGVQANIGGKGTWRTYLTLPNILKEYNPELIGYALEDSLTSQSASQLSVAEIGAMSKDLPFMAKYLINKIKKDARIDVKKHWKLISIFIGHNDFCSEICAVPSPWSIVENHKIELVKTLRILRDNLPRTFIAIQLPPHLKELVASRKGRNSLKCYVTTLIECSCLFALQFQDRRQEYYKVIRRWQELEEEIADYPEFHRNDFTVVALPFLKNSKLPLTDNGYYDLSYLSIDCFHLNQKGNAQIANNLWNSLLEPVGNKSTSWTPIFEKFLCPTSERPFLMTRENSK
ncbi:phospholipase B1, membrane-associated-like isoform X2 [Apis cerana]|uniref:phospholipase B1, membrane-associated-like isoform X2 n=1 Tax=Apis cerana TaxID=7461 RepID=UPI002B233037|nr:phospholipase B1, membrane-associated-like isoform X2 [Apis cerana]